jgi:3-methyladenine DNA glycosylase/8-oxoguanine DNA glycosylase
MEAAHARLEIVPRSPFRLPGGSADGVVRRRGPVLERLLHVDAAPVRVRAAQPARDRVVLGAWAPDLSLARAGLDRLRFALGVDDDLRPFLEAFRWDARIGGSVRSAPSVRPMRRALPFEALAWAICEQLVTFDRAVAIERRILRALGRRCPATGLRDLPAPEALAGCAPALLESFDLAGRRALALVRCAREVAAGRVDLDGDHGRARARLARIPTVGTWTLDVLALHGQGRLDALPAGDLNLRKLVGRWRTGGDPAARAEEEEVREAFAPYGRWAGVAMAHALRTAPGASARLAAA